MTGRAALPPACICPVPRLYPGLNLNTPDILFAGLRAAGRIDADSLLSWVT
jgi:hypothetical protein